MYELKFSPFQLDPAHPWYTTVTDLIFYDVYGLQAHEIATPDQRSIYLDGNDYYVLSRGRELCAIGGLSWYEPSEDICKLDALAVPEHLRNQGYGSELLRNLEVVAREAGASVMRLVARPLAKKFYEDRGFINHPSENSLLDMAKSFVATEAQKAAQRD